MKVKFKYGIRAYTGTLDEMTYSSYKKDAVCIGRKWVKPKPTENCAKIGGAGQKIGAIWKETSPEFKEDMKAYAQAYGNRRSEARRISPNAYTLFVKALYNWAKNEDPVYDLSGVAYDDIAAAGGLITSVNSIVTNGFLPAVPGWEDMTNLM